MSTKYAWSSNEVSKYLHKILIYVFIISTEVLHVHHIITYRAPSLSIVQDGGQGKGRQVGGGGKGRISRWLRKGLTGVVQGISGKGRFLVRFQDGCEKNMTSNQLTAVTVEKRPVHEEPEVPTIDVIPDEKVYPEKVFYHGVHILLHFNKDDGVNRKEDQADIDPYADAEEMEDVRLGLR